jgi:hypothetical protein
LIAARVAGFRLHLSACFRFFDFDNGALDLVAPNFFGMGVGLG